VSEPLTEDGGRPGRWRAVLVSALVWPGAGQLVSGRALRGFAFAGTTLGLVAALVIAVARETLRRLPADPLSVTLPEIFRLAHEIRASRPGLFLSLTLLLVVVWGLSVADAWRTAAATPSSDRPATPPAASSERVE
jgi:hypothetical protein